MRIWQFINFNGETQPWLAVIILWNAISFKWRPLLFLQTYNPFIEISILPCLHKYNSLLANVSLSNFTEEKKISIDGDLMVNLGSLCEIQRPGNVECNKAIVSVRCLSKSWASNPNHASFLIMSLYHSLEVFIHLN